MSKLNYQLTNWIYPGEEILIVDLLDRDNAKYEIRHEGATSRLAIFTSGEFIKDAEKIAKGYLDGHSITEYV